MNKIRIKGFNIGDDVLITTFNPPLKAKIADIYELPFNQVPMTNSEILNKYYNKNVPIIEVFLDGKIRSFVADIVKKA